MAFKPRLLRRSTAYELVQLHGMNRPSSSLWRGVHHTPFGTSAIGEQCVVRHSLGEKSRVCTWNVCNRGRYAPAHLVWVERMIMH